MIITQTMNTHSREKRPPPPEIDKAYAISKTINKNIFRFPGPAWHLDIIFQQSHDKYPDCPHYEMLEPTITGGGGQAFYAVQTA